MTNVFFTLLNLAESNQNTAFKDCRSPAPNYDFMSDSKLNWNLGRFKNENYLMNPILFSLSLFFLF